MNKLQQLTALAQQIAAAADAEDWRALAAADRQVHLALPEWRATKHWAPLERDALAALQQVHGQARARCSARVADLSQRLADMCDHKDGWIAYALGNLHHDEATA